MVYNNYHRRDLLSLTLKELIYIKTRTKPSVKAKLNKSYRQTNINKRSAFESRKKVYYFEPDLN